MKLLEFPKTWYSEKRQKKNSHTQLNNGRKYNLSLSLSLFPRAMGANDIAQDEFRCIHAIVPSRDVRLRARLHGEIFPGRFFLGRGKICA
jgi:hypothetical protein